MSRKVSSFEFNEESGEALTPDKLVDAIRNGTSDQIKKLLETGIDVDENFLAVQLESKSIEMFPTLTYFGLGSNIETQNVSKANFRK